MICASVCAKAFTQLIILKSSARHSSSSASSMPSCGTDSESTPSRQQSYTFPRIYTILIDRFYIYLNNIIYFSGVYVCYLIFLEDVREIILEKVTGIRPCTFPPIDTFTDVLFEYSILSNLLLVSLKKWLVITFQFQRNINYVKYHVSAIFYRYSITKVCWLVCLRLSSKSVFNIWYVYSQYFIVSYFLLLKIFTFNKLVFSVSLLRL